MGGGGLMVFYLNLVFTAVMFVFFSRRTLRKSMFLSPHMVLWGAPLLLVFYPALLGQPKYLHDTGFNLVITAGLLGSLLASLLIPIPEMALRGDSPEPGTTKAIRIPQWLVSGGALLYGAYLIGTVLMLVIRYGGVIAALSVGRVYEYLHGGLLKGSTFELLLLLPEVLYYFYLGEQLAKKRYLRTLFLVLLLCLFMVFVANTRLPMILPLVALGLILLSKVPDRLRHKMFPIVISGGVAAVLFATLLGSYIRGGWVTDYDYLFTHFQEMVSNQQQEDFGYYKFLHDLYEKVEDRTLPLDYGAAWYFYGPVSVYPRMFWPGKPITSTSNRLTESVYQVTIGSGEPITTFTIYGEGFFQFGYLGAMLAPGLLLLVYCLELKVARHFQYSEYWAAMLLLQMLPFFRAELPTPQFITTMSFMGALYLVRRQRRTWQMLQPSPVGGIDLTQ